MPPEADYMSPETNRVEVFRNYNLEERLEVAKALAKIEGSILDQDRSDY